MHSRKCVCCHEAECHDMCWLPVRERACVCFLIWQRAVKVFLFVTQQFYDARVVDHLVTALQGALGNHDRHFLNAAKEWPCHDWRSRCCRMIYILLSLLFPAQHKTFGFALQHFQMYWRDTASFMEVYFCVKSNTPSLEHYQSIAIISNVLTFYSSTI